MYADNLFENKLMDVSFKKVERHFFRNNIILKQQFDHEFNNIQKKE